MIENDFDDDEFQSYNWLLHSPHRTNFDNLGSLGRDGYTPIFRKRVNELSYSDCLVMKVTKEGSQIMKDIGMTAKRGVLTVKDPVLLEEFQEHKDQKFIYSFYLSDSVNTVVVAAISASDEHYDKFYMECLFYDKTTRISHSDAKIGSEIRLLPYGFLREFDPKLTLSPPQLRKQILDDFEKIPFESWYDMEEGQKRKYGCTLKNTAYASNLFGIVFALFVFISICMTPDPFFECATECHPTIDIVCGSDGRAYVNECYLNCADVALTGSKDCLDPSKLQGYLWK